MTDTQTGAAAKGAAKPKKLRRAPGPGAASTLRGARFFWKDPVKMLLDSRQRYGDVTRFQVGRKFVLHLISHPDHIEHVLLTNNRNYRKHSPNALLKQEIGHGLLLNEGESWFSQRRLMQPSFHPRQFSQLVDCVSRVADILLGEWRERRDGERLDIENQMLHLSQMLIGQTMLSRDIGPEMRGVLDTSGGKLGLLVGNIKGTPKYRRFQQGVRNFDATVYGEIKRRRADMDNAPLDMLTMLLGARDKDTGEAMSDKQLRDEIVTLIIAGFDTTARTLTWTWLSLAQNPDVEARLHGEIETVLGDREPEYEDVAKLVYTGQILQESMRLFPPNAIIGREAIKSDEIGGYHIPAGSLLTLSSYLTHRHEPSWPDAERFDPERFAPGAGSERHRFAYFPFGGGPRQCIGKGMALMNSTLLLAIMARKYRVRAVPDHVVKHDIAVTLHPQGGLPMTLHKRTEKPKRDDKQALKQPVGKAQAKFATSRAA